MAKKSGGGVHVKAHTRAGKRVRAYTRGSKGTYKSKSSQYKKTIARALGEETATKFAKLKPLKRNPLSTRPELNYKSLYSASLISRRK